MDRSWSRMHGRNRRPLELGALGVQGGALLLLALIVGAVQAAPDTGVGRGLIYGTLYTAKHLDSIAVRTGITLIYRDPDGEKRRVETTTDSEGRFSFSDLPTNGSISYVLRVQGEQSPYLSSPLEFEAGEERLLFNFVVPGPLPPGMHPGRSSTAPAPVDARPAEAEAAARPEPMNEWLLLVLAFAACAILGYLVRLRKPRANQRPPKSATMDEAPGSTVPDPVVSEGDRDAG